MSHEENAEGLHELLDAGADPSFLDVMPTSICVEHAAVIQLLLKRGMEFCPSWFCYWHSLCTRDALPLLSMYVRVSASSFCC
jgi:hypothetical protein